MLAVNGFRLSRDVAVGLLAAAVVGLVASVLPMGVVAFAGVLVLVASSRFAKYVPAAVVVGCSLYGGIYLTYRADLGGITVSALDAAPICLFLAAFSLKDRAVASHWHRWGLLTLGLFTIGVITGLLVVFLQGGFGYQSGRVVRTEVQLVIALLAALVGGNSPTWREGVARGLVAAALIAATLQLLSEGWQLTFGTPLWSHFPFGANTVAGLSDINGLVDVSNTRDNLLMTFVMLPAMALFAFRLRGRDAFLLAYLVLASVATLSRSMWLATIVTLVFVWVVRRALGQRISVVSAIALGIAALVVVVSVNTWAGSIIGARASDSFSSTDISANYRSTETTQTIDALKAQPSSLLVGLGAGAFIPDVGSARNDPTPILENEMLARLTNFGLASVLATLVLLIAAPWAAFVGLKRDPDDPLLGLALAFPSVLAISTISGAVLQLQITMPLWILAGTVLQATSIGRLPKRPRRLPAEFEAFTATAPRTAV